MDMKTSYKKKEAFLKEFKAESKEVEAKIIRKLSELEKTSYNKETELQKQKSDLDQAVLQVKASIKDVEEAAEQSFNGKVHELSKNWEKLTAALNNLSERK